MPSIVGGFVVKNDPRGLQKQPRGNVPLAWPSPIHPFRGRSRGQILTSQPRRPIRSSNERNSAKDGHYHEVASLHVQIIAKRASNSRNIPGEWGWGWGGGGGGGGVNKKH